jgi:hypothetical protein
VVKVSSLSMPGERSMAVKQVSSRPYSMSGVFLDVFVTTVHDVGCSYLVGISVIELLFC